MDDVPSTPPIHTSNNTPNTLQGNSPNSQIFNNNQIPQNYKKSKITIKVIIVTASIYILLCGSIAGFIYRKELKLLISDSVNPVSSKLLNAIPGATQLSTLNWKKVQFEKLSFKTPDNWSSSNFGSDVLLLGPNGNNIMVIVILKNIPWDSFTENLRKASLDGRTRSQEEKEFSIDGRSAVQFNAVMTGEEQYTQVVLIKDGSDVYVLQAAETDKLTIDELKTIFDQVVSTLEFVE